MANYKVVDADRLDADLASVADAIREKTGGTENLAFPEGFAASQETVFQAGRKAYWDLFWDEFQRHGRRTAYERGFAYAESWNDAIFYPKYDIVVQGTGYYLFAETNITDLKGRLEECGVRLDTSGATNLAEAFAWSNALTRLPVISLESDTRDSGYIFNSASLTWIDGIILPEDGSKKFASNWFIARSRVTHAPVSGVIGNSGFSMQGCTGLDKESLVSVIHALSTATTGLTVTLSLAAVNTAFETSPGAADGSTSPEWIALTDTKTNWTIALA